ncbi:MAG: hypothetical protein ACOYME_02710 [Prochlorotrichaceae cyanobacterium]
MSPLSTPLMERIGASSQVLCRTLRSRFSQFLQGFVPMSSESPLGSTPDPAPSPSDVSVISSTEEGEAKPQTVATPLAIGDPAPIVAEPPSPATVTGSVPPAAPVSVAPLSAQSISAQSISRVPLNLQPTKSTPAPSGLVRRPIDPSPVQVSYTVSIAGTRPVMMTPPQSSQAMDLRRAPTVLNRPIASNETEDTARILEYLD